MHFYKSIIIIFSIVFLLILLTSNPNIEIITNWFNQPNKLMILDSRPLQAKPGEKISLKIKTWTEDTFPPMLKEVSKHVIWSITPQEGINLNSYTGELYIKKTTPNGRVYTITANFKDGGSITNKTYIYTSEGNPLVGYWKGKNNGIREFVFRADFTFSLTFDPFESYKDYWGNYSFSLNKNSIELLIDNGNFIPEDIKPEGNFWINKEGDLVLDEIYLGTFEYRSSKKHSGHENMKYIFKRY